MQALTFSLFKSEYFLKELLGPIGEIDLLIVIRFICVYNGYILILLFDLYKATLLLSYILVLFLALIGDHIILLELYYSGVFL